MKPLNEKERTQLILKFIGFFLLAVMFFVVPIVFAKKINVVEKERVKKLNNEFMDKDKLASMLDSAFQALNSYRLNGTETYIKIAEDKISELELKYERDSLNHFKTMKIATNILRAYQQVVINTKKIKDGDRDCEKDVREAKEKAKEDFEKLEKEYQRYREEHRAN